MKRKLTRETLTELAKRMPVLSEEVQHSYVGGYRYDNTFCFYNCMEYFAKEVCNQNVDCEFFEHLYIYGDGVFSGTHNEDELRNGPLIQNEDGTINADPFIFFSHCFNIEGSGWTVGSGVQFLFASGSVENTAVFGIYVDSDYIAHAVILQGYDRATDTYTCYDPSVSGTEEEKIKTVSGSQMAFAVRAGCK